MLKLAQHSPHLLCKNSFSHKNLANQLKVNSKRNQAIKCLKCTVLPGVCSQKTVLPAQIHSRETSQGRSNVSGAPTMQHHRRNAHQQRILPRSPTQTTCTSSHLEQGTPKPLRNPEAATPPCPTHPQNLQNNQSPKPNED